uniref:C2H2-type domain-containing protein n=1 Tax=Strongyloides stercoralis TaxID=6248 RepID=A0AAF5DKA9_STRER
MNNFSDLPENTTVFKCLDTKCPFSETLNKLLAHINIEHNNIYHSTQNIYKCLNCNSKKLFNRITFIEHAVKKHKQKSDVKNIEKYKKMTLSSLSNYQTIDNNLMEVDEIVTDNDYLPSSFDVLQKIKEISYPFLIKHFFTNEMINDFNIVFSKTLNYLNNLIPESEENKHIKNVVSQTTLSFDILKMTDPNLLIKEIPLGSIKKGLSNEFIDRSLFITDIEHDLTNFLNNKNIKSMLRFNPRNNLSNDIITSPLDGTRYLNIYKSVGPFVAVELYFDDFSPNINKGGHRYNHQMTAFYYRIANLGHVESGKLEKIRFLGIAEAKMAKETNYTSSIETIIETFNSINVNLGDKNYPVRVLNILGDNYGLNSVHLLCRSFARNLSNQCRGCVLKTDEWQNLDLYEHFPQDKKRYLSNNEILNQYICSFDCFHDLNEGVLQDIAGKVFSVILYDNSIISYQNLEKILFSISNKLSTGFKLNSVLRTGMLKSFSNSQVYPKLCLNGGQFAILLKIMPIVVNTIIDNHMPTTENNIVNVRLLLEASLNILSFSNVKYRNNQDVKYFKEQLSNFARLHKIVFESKPFKIKMHNLIHYEHFCNEMGLVSFGSTIRFESMNLFSKKIINLNNNKINIAKSCAQKIVRKNIMKEFCNDINISTIKKYKKGDYIITSSRKFARIDEINENDTKYTIKLITVANKYGAYIIENECTQCFVAEENSIIDKCHCINLEKLTYLIPIMYHCIY